MNTKHLLLALSLLLVASCRTPPAAGPETRTPPATEEASETSATQPSTAGEEATPTAADGTGVAQNDLPRVVLGKLQVSGALNKEVVRRLIRQQLNRVEFCHAQLLKRPPAETGQAVLRFSVVPTGYVVDAEILSSTIQGGDIDRCLLSAVRKIRFVSAQARTTVTQSLLLVGIVTADDPFAQRADALAVAESDGSSSIRARMKLKKMMPDMVMVQVKAVDDAKFPDCTFTGRLLKAAQSKDKHFKLMARGKTYRFAPVLKKRGRRLVLEDQMTQNNLGACYYPPRTKLVVRVGGVDLKTKTFKAQEIYLK